MIRTPLSTVIGGVFWTPESTVVGGTKLSSETVIGGAKPSSETAMKKLFANGEQGFFYDPSDLSTMFQNAAGTIPVTAAGQPVGLMLDKSGRNNHAYQTASLARPILRDNPKHIDFGVVYDKLITNLPAQLTGCTVIRSVPNVGTQILANQTIPTTYNDDTDHYGLLVINRALTPSETSAITDEFNKMAGV